MEASGWPPHPTAAASKAHGPSRPRRDSADAADDGPREPLSECIYQACQPGRLTRLCDRRDTRDSKLARPCDQSLRLAFRGRDPVWRSKCLALRVPPSSGQTYPPEAVVLFCLARTGRPL